MPMATSLPLDDPEIKSGFDRVRWAENLIRHLPVQHDGRNSWLINYGTGRDVDDMRKQWEKISGSPWPPPDGTIAILSGAP